MKKTATSPQGSLGDTNRAVLARMKLVLDRVGDRPTNADSIEAIEVALLRYPLA